MGYIMTTLNFKGFLGLDSYDKDSSGKQWTHAEKYQAIVNALGYDAVKRCIPFTLDQIKEAIQKDEHLNNLSMKKWDLASGFVNEGIYCKHVGSQLTSIYRKIGVNSFSNSDGVCILKECARMWSEEI
jgi:hypothetical protein